MQAMRDGNALPVPPPGKSVQRRQWITRLANRVLPPGLSGRLLVLTILFVLVAEVLIYLPSVVGYRTELLTRRLEAAQLAALSLEAADDNNIAMELTEELLANAEVVSVILKRNEQRSLFLSPDQMPPIPEEQYDLTGDDFVRKLSATFSLLLRSDDRLISVRSTPRLQGGVEIEAVMLEGPIRGALLTYSRNIFFLSLFISVLTAGCVYLAIHYLLVRPMQRIERSMIAFRGQPEDAHSLIEPSERRDEVGSAERELSLMQGQLRASLNQQARLAALGTAVSKINHDLRNILTSAQLVADRLEQSEDPKVQRLAPKLVSSIDRAVSLCANTMRYGRADERPPELIEANLRNLVEEVIAALPLPDAPKIDLNNEVPNELVALVDSEQVFRILLNLARNAAQALERSGEAGQVTIGANAGKNRIEIDVVDTGPGIPEKVKESLFAPFGASQNPTGAGLGLAIAAELARGHGGTVDLVDSNDQGARFRLTLPQKNCG